MLLMYVIVSRIWEEVLNSQVDANERVTSRMFNRVVTFQEIRILINVS